MALAVFDISFRGASRAGTTSDNPAIAAAVIGIDTILTSGSLALYGDIVEPQVDIRPQEGRDEVRFEVDLGFRLNYGMARRAYFSGVPFYQDPQPAEVLNALGWRMRDLGDPAEYELDEGSEPGLVQLLLDLAGRPVDRIFLTGDVVDVETGNSLYRISTAAYRLLRSRQVREGIHALARALRDPAVKEIEIIDRASGSIISCVRPQDSLALAVPDVHEVTLIDELHTMALSLVAPVFCNDACWTFTDGLQTITAVMRDQEFLRLASNGVITLHPGDVIIASMHLVTVQNDRGLESSLEVVRVIDHRKPVHHLLMPGI